MIDRFGNEFLIPPRERAADALALVIEIFEREFCSMAVNRLRVTSLYSICQGENESFVKFVKRVKDTCSKAAKSTIAFEEIVAGSRDH